MWNAPHRPVAIYGDTYDVGPAGLSVILITSPRGDVLIDGALPESAPQIVENIKALGVSPHDVKLILNSHPHFDHAGGIEALRSVTGAEVAASPWSARMLRAGNSIEGDPQFGIGLSFPTVRAVTTLHDGETFRVGTITITAHLTPGHTPGGTTWSWRSCDRGRCLDMVYADSENPSAAPGFLFTDSSAHPHALSNFERSFRVIADLHCDILLTPHPEVSNLWSRIASRDSGHADALIDRDACRRYAADGRNALAARVAAEEVDRRLLRHDLDSILTAAGHPTAAVARDVRTGSMRYVGRAGGRPGESSPLDASTPIRPLSVVKLLESAIWVDHFGTAGAFTCRGEPIGAESIESVIANGCDSAGKDLAIQLRHRLGSAAVLSDLNRLGFQKAAALRIAAPANGDGVRLDGPSAHSGTTLSDALSDSAWAAALSVGEADFATNLLDLSGLLRTIGHDGLTDAGRVLESRTAKALQNAMAVCVNTGTGRAIRDALSGTGWTIGGKTGTGPGIGRPQSGGLFAGLAIDPQGEPRYAIVVVTEGAGPGGGVAALAAAAIARRLILASAK